MRQVLILVVFYAVEYAVSAAIVGIAFFALFGHTKAASSAWKPLVSFFLFFCLRDYYYLPVYYMLDLTMTVGNREVAELLGLKPNIGLTEMFEFGPFDIFKWGIQAAIAYYVGIKVYLKIIKGRSLEGSA